MPEDSHLGKRADWISSLIQTAPAEMSELAPYLRLWCAEVLVRDQTLSRQFYLEKLGFELIFDSADSEDAVSRLVRSTGQHWLPLTPKISAGPMFLGACLALSKPDDGSEISPGKRARRKVSQNALAQARARAHAPSKLAPGATRAASRLARS